MTQIINRETTLKKITDETALRAAACWVDGPSSLKLINNQINCVYRFEANNQGYYLRITHETIRSQQELLGSIDFQRHLLTHEAPICEAIPSKQGQWLEIIPQGELQFLVHVCLEVPGEIMHFDHVETTTYVQWGQALARLHQASKSYNPGNNHFLTGEDLWQETRDYAMLDTDPEIQTIFHRIDDWFSTKQHTDFYGLTHGDHRPGNVLYDGKKIYLIDFDEPVYYSFLADIALPFLDLYGKPFKSWKTKLDGFIEGYRRILPIPDDELNQLHWFTQMKSLNIYLWCKNNWFEPTAPGGKPRDVWLQELRHMALYSLFES